MGSKDENVPLFEAKKAKGRILYRLFATTIFIGIIFIWVYRASHIPSSRENGRWVWIGMLVAEVWFGLFWVLTQSLRWNRVHRRTFPDRLSQRYEKNLPKVDIFVCTADPVVELPIMVINTVLSVMAYEYPPENLSIYLSDDAGSEITFHALLEASYFSKCWLPYCKKFKVEPRSPAAYFASQLEISDANHAEEFASTKKLYEEIENRIVVANRLGRISDKAQHDGFAKWDSFVSQGNHDSILQILIDGTDAKAKDTAGCTLPTLVYLAREKRPQHFHNFKAGAMNAFIRVSSGISNAPVILNLDCDMYSNDSQSIQDALCFFMDENHGHEIAYVQFPQKFRNMSKNDLYSGSMRVIREVEFPGIDGYGGPLYIGTGCFHRREVLCGRKFRKETRIELKNEINSNKRNIHELEERLTSLASCTYEENTQWGNEMGLKYGCPVEDVLTVLYYSIIPSLYLLKGISLFPQVSSPWFLPFTYVIVAENLNSFVEFLWSGGKFQGWWNDRRIWLYHRSCSYLFAFVDTVLKLLGFSESTFIISNKVLDEDVSKRYDEEIMEFGTDSPMTAILSSLAVLNLFCFIGFVIKVSSDLTLRSLLGDMILQILLNGILILINLPLYNALLFRKDKGRIPSSITLKSIFLALLVCTYFELL